MALFPLPALALLFALDVPVQETGPSVFHSASPKREASVADLAMAAPRLPASARHALPTLSASEKATLETTDTRRGGLRLKAPAVKVGLTRALPEEVGFEGVSAELARGQSRVVAGGLLERMADGRLAWTAAFASEGAGALRLHVRSALLPPGSRAYVYSAAGEVHGPYAFDAGTRPEGFWTNSVFAPEMFLEVQFAPASVADLARARLLVDAVGHLEHPSFAPSTLAPRGAAVRPKSQTCFIDATCVTTAEFPNVDGASHAVGQLTFEDKGSFYVCTGGLLNTDPATFTPYLLTANHCFSTQASATSLEAIWNYKRSTCNGPTPNPSLFPRTLGSTLLATGTVSDYTLVQLSQNPPNGAVFLGWTTMDVAHMGGTVLYRLSYPGGDPQIYTREQVSATPDPAPCSDAPQGNFVYEKDVAGGTGGGSSGSPAVTADLRVAGQEFGACGTNVSDDCDVVDNSTLDGSFRVTFPAVQPWIAPAAPGPCVPNASTLCLNGGRFRVTATWRTAAGASGSGTGAPLTNDAGYFWFFDAANIEIVVKVLNACGTASNHFWVFAGGLTNVNVILTVTDTTNGTLRIYENPLGTAFEPLQDTSAFACP